LASSDVVVVAAALEALSAGRPVVASVLVSVKVSVRLGLPKFKVFGVVKEDKKRSSLFLCVTWEVWKIAVCHA